MRGRPPAAGATVESETGSFAACFSGAFWRGATAVHIAGGACAEAEIARTAMVRVSVMSRRRWSELLRSVDTIDASLERVQRRGSATTEPEHSALEINTLAICATFWRGHRCQLVTRPDVLTPLRLRMAGGSGLGHGENVRHIAHTPVWRWLCTWLHVRFSTPPANRATPAKWVGMTVCSIAVVIAAVALRGR